MNANFFAIGQAQVAQAITEKPGLFQGATAGSIKRTATMAMIGTIAALSFGMAPGEASAQMTPQQFQQDLQRRQAQQEQNLIRNAQQQEFNRQNNQQRFEYQREFRKDAQKAQNKQMITGIVTSAVVGGITASVVGAVQTAMQPQRVQVVPRPQQQQYGRVPQMQQPQTMFYSPRDMDMPERFTRVSQRSNIGMAAPGTNTLDLRDGTQTSQNMVRALDNLNSSVEQAQRAQRQLDDVRLSGHQVSGQQQQQINGAMQATNNNLDRAIETYMRMSNNAALEGKNTQGFNMLAAKMVNEGLAPEQQISMNVNARTNYSFQPR